MFFFAVFLAPFPEEEILDYHLAQSPIVQIFTVVSVTVL